MSDIQTAIDILDKWREGATSGPWWISEPLSEELDAQLTYDLGVIGGGDETLATVHGPSADATLIVGTAGNTALLDAIRDFLFLGEVVGAVNKQLGREAERMATAIINADKDMNRE